MPKFTQLVNGRTRFQAMQYNARARSFNHYPKAQKTDNSRLFQHMLKKKKKEKEKCREGRREVKRKYSL